MMPYYVTLDDRGYRLAEYAKEPDNAVAGPFETAERAHLKMDYYAKQQARSEHAAGYIVIGFVVLGFIAMGWALRGVL